MTPIRWQRVAALAVAFAVAGCTGTTPAATLRAPGGLAAASPGSLPLPGPARPARAQHAVLRPTAPCGSYLRRTEDEKPVLQRQGDGVVLLPQRVMPDEVRANPGDPATTWTGDPLPPPGGGHVVIFYTPHPDDETLSAGVLLAQATQRGDRVIVVALTDGRDTHAIHAVNRRLRDEWLRAHGSLAGFQALSPADVGAARLDELRRAAAALGVRPGDIYAAHLDAPASDCGGIVSVHEADQVERAFAARFPGATHITMSFSAERQQDHLAAGEALRNLLDTHVVSDARWVVSRLWWTLPGPAWTWLTPGDPQLRQEVLAAVAQYDDWEPAMGRYGIGGFSVRSQLDAAGWDVRNRVHGLGPEVSGYGVPRPA